MFQGGCWVVEGHATLPRAAGNEGGGYLKTRTSIDIKNTTTTTTTTRTSYYKYNVVVDRHQSTVCFSHFIFTRCFLVCLAV